jgi:hypothetical protein
MNSKNKNITYLYRGLNESVSNLQKAVFNYSQNISRLETCGHSWSCKLRFEKNIWTDEK